MTDKQKQAILILNRLHRLHQNYRVPIFNDDDYFLLMDFIVGNNEPQVTTYVPYIQTDPKPLDPVYGKFGKVTCDDYKVVTVPCTQNMEER